MVRVGFRGRDRVRTTFSDRNVVPGLTKYFDDDHVLLGKITVTYSI